MKRDNENRMSVQTDSKISIEDVRRMLRNPLPGRSAHEKMFPEVPPQYEYALSLPTPPADSRQSAVLILLFPKDGTPHFVLTRRSNDLPHHKGQVSLPGGARDAGESLEQTALREANEELGITVDDVAVLGRLSPYFVPPSNFCIFPFVAGLPYQPSFRPAPQEVDAVLEVPLSDLLQPGNKRVEYWPDPNFTHPRRVPFYDLGGWVVWGATAAVLSELETVMQENLPPTERWQGAPEEASMPSASGGALPGPSNRRY